MQSITTDVTRRAHAKFSNGYPIQRPYERTRPEKRVNVTLKIKTLPGVRISRTQMETSESEVSYNL
jgi:hypothetical protein